MTGSLSLLGKRRFLPLFATQLLGAFNDNLFKNAMVLFVVYNILDSERDETLFSGLASLIFILPFFLLSAMAGQLADTRDKALIIRIVKFCEILIMIVGGAGLLLAWQGIAVELVAIPLLLLALFAMWSTRPFSARSNMRFCHNICPQTRCWRELAGSRQAPILPFWQARSSPVSSRSKLRRPASS